ncbi:MAG: hypothetical protein HY689_07645 [Chloroflexi bacterium]|nr:hypothetical protein [Chloroflexota bacterium]
MTTVPTQATRLFRCPVCNQADIHQVEGRGLLFRSHQIAPCPVCGVRFTYRGGGRFALAACDPARVAVVRAMQAPLGCVRCLPCPVGRARPPEEWESLRQVIHLPPGQPSWPPLPPTIPLPPLEPGEVLRFAQGGIYLGEAWPGHLTAGGHLFMTDRRLVYRGPLGEALELPLDQVAAVEHRVPALTIWLQGRHEPLVFFSRTGDGVLRSLASFLTR